MATLPTPEESGRRILNIFRNDNIRAGEMLLIQVIRTHWGADRIEDLLSGLHWLGEQGFIEQQDDRTSQAVFLTEAGFQAI